MRFLKWVLFLCLSGLAAAAPSGPLMGADMPGKSHRGPLSPLTPKQKALAMALRADVEVLGKRIGERNVHHLSLIHI